MRKLSYLAGGGIALLVILFLLSNFYTDFLWFKEIGYSSVFWKTILIKAVIFAAGSLIAALFIYFNLYAAKRNYVSFRSEPKLEDEGEKEEDGYPPFSRVGNIRLPKPLDFLLKPHAELVLLGISILLGLVLSQGLLTEGAFQRAILFFHKTSFGITEPILNKDVSFYTHLLPFSEVIYNYVIAVLLVTILIAAVIYGLSGMFFDLRYRQRALNHGTTILVFIFLVYGAGYIIKIANLLYSPQGVVFGAGYTDVHVILPYYKIAIFISLIAAALAVMARRRQNLKLLVAGPALIIGAGILSVLLSAAVQSFYVTPNEIAKETPYIKYNIHFTRLAYGLNDLTEKEFQAETNLTAEDLQENSNIINNIRVVDPLPSLTTYNQTQSIRPYYQFFDVDVDRYVINGDYRQLFISAREMTQDANRSWINRHIKYTHGYGVVASPVNRVTAQGQPLYLIKDIPPVSSVDLKVERPEIYFGERTDDYIIVGANTPELDYPQGDNNVETKYKGRAGISLNFLNRVAFALRQHELKILISGELNQASKIVINRNINTRAKKIAPFLHYDDDNYIVVSGGKLYWIKDAYTTSAYYPYAQPVQEGLNYIRNSVKVVIDAYNGSIDYYVVDDKDPVLASYRKAFPSLFKDVKEMPEGLRSHLRYPRDLFQIQAQMMTTYHMTNPGVFYNKEDQWNIATEIYGSEPQPVNPYYSMVELGKGEEFVLMLPLTPANKNNMIAWLAARNDGENYGELFLYKFPKRKLVYGPMQIEARIDQDPNISSLLTLWGQRGSDIIRGNLFVVPVKDCLLYVEPLYLQAAAGEGQTAIPEMKRVIVAYGETIVMRETLADALNSIFAGGAQRTTVEEGTRQEGPVVTPQELIERANDLYNQAQESLRQGNWAEYGRLMEDLKQTLVQLKDATT